MGRQCGGRRQRRATPAVNEPPSKAMGHAAVTKADTGGTSWSARQTVLLHLKPEPKLICPLASIDHFCACGYLDGGSKSNGSRRRRRRREPDAAVVFAPPLGYRLRQQLHFRRQALGGWGRKGRRSEEVPGAVPGQRRRRWRRWVVAEAAPRRRRWRRWVVAEAAPVRAGARSVVVASSKTKTAVVAVAIRSAEMEAGGADSRGGEVAVARGWCSRGRCGRAWWQRPSVTMAWRGGGEGKVVAGNGGEWPDGRPFFSDVAQGYLRPTASKKTDSRPPRQHDKYPLDGAVFIGKYPRL
uniref:Uncharacterized protein n=1 Tax=Oryza barthii TaxID=65489 RepID=A0A0D3EPW3_9ORYZ